MGDHVSRHALCADDSWLARARARALGHACRSRSRLQSARWDAWCMRLSANGTSTSRLGWASAVRLHRRVAARALRASQTRPEYVRQPEIPMTMWKQGTTCGHAMPWCTYDATAGYRRRSLASSSIIYATYDAPPTRPASHRTRTTLCAAAMTTIPPSTFRYKRCGRLVLVSALSEAARPQASNAATCAHSIPVCKQLIPTRPVCARAQCIRDTSSRCHRYRRADRCFMPCKSMRTYPRLPTEREASLVR